MNNLFFNFESITFEEWIEPTFLFSAITFEEYIEKVGNPYFFGFII